MEDSIDDDGDERIGLVLDIVEKEDSRLELANDGVNMRRDRRAGRIGDRGVDVESGARSIRAKGAMRGMVDLGHQEDALLDISDVTYLVVFCVNHKQTNVNGGGCEGDFPVSILG